MADGTPDPEPGDNLRRLRRWRGLDQATVAGLTGRSQGWLSRVEAGRLRLDRTADLEALADVLQVHPGDLTGRPHRPASGRTYAVDAWLPAIRVALVDDVPDAPPRPVAELADRVRRLSQLMWRDGDLVGLAAALPALVGEVRLASLDGATEEDRRRALGLLSVTCSVAFPTLKNLGHVDLALVATTRSVMAAEELGDPLWRAYAGFRKSHALIPAGSPDRALRVIRRAVDELEPHVSDDPADTADVRHGAPDRGPVGVQGRAVGHHAYLHTYLGQGLIAARRADEAVRELRMAEDLAPLRFRSRDIVPSLVMALLGQPMRPASLRELRGLAYRVGVG